jgi:site-specific recombinase XerD
MDLKVLFMAKSRLPECLIPSPRCCFARSRRTCSPPISLRNQTFLFTAYAPGLPVFDLCALQLTDIESAPDRM